MNCFRLLPVRPVNVFQVISFPNDACDGGSRNGTCYTEAECDSRGGTNAGSCASGFGVCCVSEFWTMLKVYLNLENNIFFFQFPLAVAQLQGKIAPTSPVRAQLLEVARYFMNFCVVPSYHYHNVLFQVNICPTNDNICQVSGF